MTTSDIGSNDVKGIDVQQINGKMEANLKRMEELTQRLVAALSSQRSIPKSLQGPSQDLFMKAGASFLSEAMQNPAKLMEQQMQYWSQAVQNYIDVQQTSMQSDKPVSEKTAPKDRRFSNPLWETHPYFNYIRQQYQSNVEAVQNAVSATEGLDDQESKQLSYFSNQIIDLLCPTNFLATNPDALERAVETDCESLVHGLENMIADIEAHNGDMVVTLADPKAFVVGENLATTPGEVVFRNRLFELIQYTPSTEKVFSTPLVLFPPWINKFYILDLKPQNSLIKWIVDQGYTLFVVSWVNPDASYRDTSMSDYIEEGYVEAITQAKAICKVKQVNAIGYCIAGTTLSLTLAVMNKRGDTSINSATLFTTLTDFSDQGEVGVFLDDNFVDGIEQEVNDKGILDSFYMSRTFSFLRSNDLIYAPAIRSYMLGEAPPAFDLLFWNGDGTNLPAAMTIEYLRGLCKADQFATTGISVAGELVQLGDVDVPICAIACKSDHIAAWISSYAGVQMMGSEDKTFILSGSGHIAGIVNPPSKNKYGHQSNPDLSLPAEKWLDGAEAYEGSWWPMWEKWLRPKSGKKIKARRPGGPDHPALCPAPGTYVVSNPKD